MTTGAILQKAIILVPRCAFDIWDRALAKNAGAVVIAIEAFLSPQIYGGILASVFTARDAINCGRSASDSREMILERISAFFVFFLLICDHFSRLLVSDAT